MASYSFTSPLSGIVFRTSNFIAWWADPRRILNEIARELAAHLGARLVEISLRTASGKIEVRLAAPPLAAPAPPFLVFSRPIGSPPQDFGQFRAEIGIPSQPPSGTILALETVGTLLAQMAGQLRLKERRESLREEIADAQDSLLRDKMLARARGILAVLLGVSQEEAGRRLEQEARRLGRPVEVVADRLILTRTTDMMSAPAAPALALRKTA